MKMKNLVFLMSIALSFSATRLDAQPFIRVQTDRTDLIFCVNAETQRLYQFYLGDRLANDADYLNLPETILRKAVAGHHEAYSCSGTDDYFESALAIEHNDGNLTTYLKYISHEIKNLDDNQSKTVIRLRDEVYSMDVKLVCETFAKENIIKIHSEIVHNEKKPVRLSQYASAMLHFSSKRYFLTEFSGDWAREAALQTQELLYGKKVLDTNLGARAAMFVSPFFQLGFDAVSSEETGRVLVGTLGWTGNFRFTFEIDNVGDLRIVSGINPHASNYELQPGTVFQTPEFIFTLSSLGVGQASRDLHSWARRYQIRDGMGERLTLLNNWEATGFDFDEPKLASLMRDAKDLGVDMFLLDDGWFANKYPRSNDRAGLGDWSVTSSKLPNGLPFLVKTAKETGIKFGLWVEPEMVNPKSELFEQHPEWVIMQPNRKPYYFRNQLVLDLSNPAVQTYVFEIINRIMTENPDIAFLKWDCNSPITNIYSPWLQTRQHQLYIDHVRGVNQVFSRVQAAFPSLPMMLCSGGGGRCDYEALKYFTEFWPSDNTDPVERLFIQWGFSQVFPAKSMCAHVTSWNSASSLKFRTDVAMMCKLGFDVRYGEMNDRDKDFCRRAVANYKRLTSTILDGDMYRLVSPYEGNHTASVFVNATRTKAVLFAFDIHPRYSEHVLPVVLRGLDPTKLYRITETNLSSTSGRHSNIILHDKTLSGDYLMKAGIDVFTSQALNSRVIELTAE
jgi:alpha-galactosidase